MHLNVRVAKAFVIAVALHSSVATAVTTASAAERGDVGTVDTSEVAALCLSVIPDLDRWIAELDSRFVTYACVLYGPRPGDPRRGMDPGTRCFRSTGGR